jgi:branched-chain amino acid transport system permease protein
VTAPGRVAQPPRGRRLVHRLRLRVPEQPMIRHLLVAVLGGLCFYLISCALSSYDNFQLGEIALYAIAIAGLSVLTGSNGQISLGHGALMAVGAYTIALEMNHTHLNLVIELLSAVGAAAVIGVVVGVPATRLRGPYLAGMTLLFALGLPLLADKYSATLGGDQGLTTTPPPPPGGIDPQVWLTWIEILGALISLVLLANLMRSRFGRAFRAVRDDDIAAALAGIHVARTQVIAFALSAACAGLAGAFLALSTGVVNTGEFPLTLSIGILAGMVLGGAGSLVGPWWGAIALVYLPQWSTSLSNAFSLGSGVAAYLATIIYGVVLIVVILLAPSGIQGGLRRAGTALRPHLPLCGDPSATVALRTDEAGMMASHGSKAAGPARGQVERPPERTEP